MPDCLVDHINGDSLDNRRENLRIATYSQNSMNRSPYSGKIKGVGKRISKVSGKVKFFARVIKEKKLVFFKSFDTEKDAILAYNREATKHFGPFAKLNKV